MQHLSKLKDKSNNVTKQKFFISEQVPDGFTESRKQVSAWFKVLTDKNSQKPTGQRSSIQIINNTILVDDKPDLPEITTPQPVDLFLDPTTQREVDQVQRDLVETEPIMSQSSEFIGLVARANSTAKVQKFYTAVMQRYPSVDHAIMAYALKEEFQVKTSCCDDWEFGAGTRLKKLLFETKSKDTVVFVLRKYGGVHLGFNRFAIIEQVAKDALHQLTLWVQTLC